MTASNAPTITDKQRSAIEHLMVDYVHAIDEGDYETLAPHLAGRVVETVQGHLSDEY